MCCVQFHDSTNFHVHTVGHQLLTEQKICYTLNANGDKIMNVYYFILLMELESPVIVI